MNVKNGLEVLDLTNLYHLSDLTEHSSPNFYNWNVWLSEGQGWHDDYEYSVTLPDHTVAKPDVVFASEEDNLFYYYENRRPGGPPLAVGIADRPGTR